jgi:hypothetical protein
MTEKTLISVTCRGCDAEFYLYPESQATDFCHSCKCFESAMQHLMGNHPPKPKKRMNPLLRGSLVGLALVGPFWAVFIWLCLR